MFNGWISLRVKDPKRVAAWYTDHRIMERIGSREDIGTQALGSRALRTPVRRGSPGL
jgi:hypothetical protein